MNSRFRNLIFITFILLFGIRIVSAHDIIIINNTLKINNNNIIFHNDGSLIMVVADNYIEQYLKENLIVKNDGNICTLGNITYDENLVEGFDIIISCEEDILNLSIEDKTLSGVSFPINKVYTVNVGEETKRFVGEEILKFEVNQEPESHASIFFKYTKLGFEHILSGIDHIFFIIGFIIIATSFSSLIKSITGFTVSHSFTLTISALGIFVLSPRIVEPMIAFSIIFVGIMGLFKLGDKWFSGFWLIFAFGLFHGLGFAGAISEVGFPKVGFVSALLGFNIGVEIGQLSVVLLAYPFIYLANRSKKYGKLVKGFISLFIVLAGIIWLISRIFSVG